MVCQMLSSKRLVPAGAAALRAGGEERATRHPDEPG